MANKIVSFSFPAERWEGIELALSQNYQSQVRNPAFDGSDQSIPMQIANPLTREQFALQTVMDFVAQRYEQMAVQSQMQPAQAAIQAAVAATKAEVMAATVATIVDE